jgi:hypothetical protein
MGDGAALWEELLTAAYLGTDRHPPHLPAGDDSLSELTARLDGSHPDHLLLQAAALCHHYRQLGKLPEKPAVAVTVPCEADEQARCSIVAATRLGTLLAGDYKDLIPEWLALAAARQKRVPEELLPELLNWGEGHPEQIDLLLAVIGRRGRWLAQQGAWPEKVAPAVAAGSVAPEAIEEAWLTGQKKFRLRLLGRLRSSDPARSLTLLAFTWSQESAEERTAFLEAFTSGLSMADEPFLEGALDDRSKEVRKTAAHLLAGLPESRLVKRQVERAGKFIKLVPGGFLRKIQFEISLPAACDKEMQRDGVEMKHPVKSFGEKAQWMFQILAAIPPARWCKLWGKNPTELLEAAENGEWKELLHESWMAALMLHPDRDWIKAILDFYPNGAVLTGLALEEQQNILGAVVQAHFKEGISILEGYQRPWGKALTRLVLPHLRGFYLPLQNDYGRLARLRVAFRNFGYYMDPGVTAEISARLINKMASEPDWEKEVGKLLQILDFRSQMMEELNS